MALTTSAIIGSAVIGGVSSNMAAKKGAKAVKQGEAASLAENARQFDLVRGDTANIRALGNSATDRLARLYGYATPGTPGTPGTAAQPWQPSSPQGLIASRVLGRTFDNGTGELVGGTPGVPGRVEGAPDMSAFFESPDYQFNLAETQKGTERSAAARGGLLSGGAALALQRNASGLASREYGGFVDRLMQQAGLGNTGIVASAAAGANSASNVANVSMNAGNARASIYGNNAANVNNAVQGGISNLMLQRYLGNGQAPPPALPPALPPGGGYGGGMPFSGPR